MSSDPVLDALRLTEAAADLLQRALATSQTNAHDRSEIRYAEALARTLVDQLAAVLRSSENHPPPSENRALTTSETSSTEEPELYDGDTVAA